MIAPPTSDHECLEERKVKSFETCRECQQEIFPVLKFIEVFFSYEQENVIAIEYGVYIPRIASTFPYLCKVFLFPLWL